MPSHTKEERKKKRERSMRKKGGRKLPFSKAKAKKILKEKNPTLKGKPITDKQRKLLGFIAGGGTPTRLKKSKSKSKSKAKKNLGHARAAQPLAKRDERGRRLFL